MPLLDDRTVQRALQAGGLYDGEIDGDFGLKSKKAARASAARRSPVYSPHWSDDRVRIAVEQAILKGAGFYASEIDGIPGPATQVAREKWQDHITFERPSPAPSAGVPNAAQWPRQKDMIDFYGTPGRTKNVRLEMPYPMYLDWDLSDQISSFVIHEKCHDSALRVFNRTKDHYGVEKIHDLGIDQFGGCLNVRKMRNGSAWSTHAFAAAIDFDADRNQLRESHRTARFAQPDYKAFLDFWEAEGWISLGRARDFDWMHVQAARL